MKQQAPKTNLVETGILSTNLTSGKHRVQRWSNFVAGFSLEFVDQCLREVRVPGIVLDPFMGCGTTLVGARNRGFDIVGYEAHPLFATLASTKSQSFTLTDLESVRVSIKRGRTARKLSESAHRFLGKLFSSSTLKELLRASSAVEALDASLYPLGVSLFLKVAEYACTAKTDGIYKAPDSKKRALGFQDALVKASAIFYNDIEVPWYREWSRSTKAVVHRASSVNMNQVASNTVSSVITSPPYLNNFDYAEMTRMQLYLLGWAGSWGEITELVRNDQITNTTTSLKGKKGQTYQVQCRKSLSNLFVEQLVPLVSALEEQRKVRAGKKDYNLLIYPYYSQIQSVLKETIRTMKVGARIHWIVSDAALYGVYLATHEHTASLMQNLGFRDVRIDFLRPRGHRWVLKKRDGAPGKLGEYCITARK